MCANARRLEHDVTWSGENLLVVLEHSEAALEDNAVLILAAVSVHRGSQRSRRQDLLEQSHQSARVGTLDEIAVDTSGKVTGGFYLARPPHRQGGAFIGLDHSGLLSRSCAPTVGPPRNRGHSRNLSFSWWLRGRTLSDMDRRWRFARAEDKIARLSKRGLDVVAFWHACTPVLADAVPHYLAPCCYTIDPASSLITSHFQEGMPEFPPEWIAMEYAEDDVNQLVDVARSPDGISTLYEAPGGDPSSSPRWHANMTFGGDQEMIAALRTRGGDVWGAIGLYREPTARCSTHTRRLS
jgi:hypothetical protein